MIVESKKFAVFYTYTTPDTAPTIETGQTVCENFYEAEAEYQTMEAEINGQTEGSESQFTKSKKGTLFTLNGIHEIIHRNEVSDNG